MIVQKFLRPSSRNCLLTIRLLDHRFSSVSLVRFASSDERKVEKILQILKEDIQRQNLEEEKRKQLQKVDQPKLPLTKRVINELKHYYHGFRLLALEIRVCIKYIWRLSKGIPLTRRERQQLVRTATDVLRLLPFSFFIIVPFMEFALPLYLKFFPGMLPSTFQESSKEEEKIRTQLKNRIETAKFLQDTLEEITLKRKKGSEKENLAYEFSQFVRKVRTEDGYVNNADLFKFIKLFEDEFTLDNLSMTHLRGLCRLLGISPIGSTEILRLQLHLKLRELKTDDKLIEAEGGVEVLSAQELQTACRARGMRALGRSEERLKIQLKEWLELSLDDKVPPSLLLLSRAMFFPEEISFTERIRSVLSSLPQEIVEETQQKLTELEGGRVDPKEKMEFVRRIEDALNKERQASKLAEERRAAAKEAEERHLLSTKEEDEKESEVKVENTNNKMKETPEIEIEEPKEDHTPLQKFETTKKSSDIRI